MRGGPQRKPKKIESVSRLNIMPPNEIATITEKDGVSGQEKENSIVGPTHEQRPQKTMCFEQKLTEANRVR